MEVAIIGMSCRVPGAVSISEFWRNLRDGVESIHFFSEAELEAGGVPRDVVRDPSYVKAAGVLDRIDLFDEALFGILPKDAAVMDPQQRIFLECAWEALEQAGYDSTRYPDLISVFAGIGMNTYLLNNLARRESGEDADSFHTKIWNDKDYVSTRVAYLLDMRGPAVTVQTACSTSLVAVHLATRALLTHECDMALAGGVTINVPHHTGYPFRDGMILSPDGHCRPFDAQAAGTVPSSGAGIVVLKRLADALADRDHIHAVIKGSAINNDGAVKVGFTAPGVDGQAEVIAMAHAAADVDPRTIGLVEAHGTATALGDPIEVSALTKAFGETGRTGFCALGSIKSNLGHLDTAAGVVSLIKTALALEHRMLPPTLHFTAPNPEIDFARSPFYVSAELKPFLAADGAPRRAGVSAFGLGGTNVHAVLEEAPERPALDKAPAWQLLVLSAKSATSLNEQARRLATHLSDHPEVDLGDVAFTLQAGRRALSSRSIAVCQDRADAVRVLQGLVPGRLVSGVAGSQSRPIAFLFPGGGAQHPEMAAELYRDFPVFREEFDRAIAIVEGELGLSVAEALAPGTASMKADLLARPSIGLPLLFSVEYALAHLWMALGIQPDAMIGHSAGEYAAACVAGVFDLPDALRLVTTRGRLFDRLAEGAMLSVPLGPDDLGEYLTGDLSLAAINGRSQCVLSGAKDAIANIDQLMTARGIDTVPVHIAVAAHSHLVEPILDEFRREVSRLSLRPPTLRFASNVTGAWITAEEATDPEYWVQHLRRTVRFADGLGCLLAAADRICLEVGPGHTLTSLSKLHQDRRPEHLAIASLRHPRETSGDRATFLEAAGRLWLCGAPVDWTATGETRQRVPLPTYPFERRRHWIEPTGNGAMGPNGNKAIQDLMTIQTDNVRPPAGRQPVLVQRLQAVLHDLSGIDPDVLDPTRTFLELGFESLFLTQFTQACRRAFNVTVKLRQLFGELSTLDRLAAHLDGVMPAEVPAPIVVAPQTVRAEVPVAALSDLTSAVRRAAAPGSIEHLVNQQLEVMKQQLALLAGKPVASIVMPAGAVTQAVQPVVVPPAAESSGASPLRFGPYEAIDRRSPSSLSATQGAHLASLIERYTARTRQSKALTDRHRSALADPRAVSGFRASWKEMTYQIAMVRSVGSRMWDVDGNEYIDFTMGFGVNLFGHSPAFLVEALERQVRSGLELGVLSPMAGQVAELIREFTGFDRVTFANTGSEAILGALRAARTATGRERIAVFTGGYHGMIDEVMVRGLSTAGARRAVPAAAGVPRRAVEDVLVLDYDDPHCLDLLKANARDLAAVLVEPVQSRRPNLQPKSLLEAVRAITREAGSALIFDELITGFRLHPGGAQAWYGIEADLATYGKVLSAGVPMAAIAGRSAFMDVFDGGAWRFGDDSGPEAGVTFYGGTFTRHPLGLAASLAVLTELKAAGPDLQRALNDRTHDLAQRLTATFAQFGSPARVEYCGSLFQIKFPDDTADPFTQAASFERLLPFYLRLRGVHIWDRAAFLSTAHSASDIDFLVASVAASLEEMHASPAVAVPSTAGPTPTSRELPLTDAQTEILSSLLMDKDASCAFNESNRFRFTGSLNVVALTDAVQQLVDRHEAFRTSVDASRGCQIVHATREHLTTISDCSDSPEPERTRAVDALLVSESTREFDLSAEPLLRTRLIKVSGDRHILTFTFHHIVCDGWSFSAVLTELRELYAAACERRPAALATVRQFSDFVAYSSDTSRAEAVEDAAYWTAMYHDLPPALDLPVDRPRPVVRTHRGGQEIVVLDEHLGRTVKSFGVARNCSLFVTLLAGYQLLLHRLSGQRDLAVGIPVAGQLLLGTEPLVGHCTNLLPLRSQLADEPSFAMVMERVKQSVLDAYDHQHYTFGNLVRAVNAARDSSRLPIVEVIFNLDNVGPMGSWAGLEVTVDGAPKSFVTFDLSLNCLYDNDRVVIECNYNADLFDDTTIRRWLSHLTVLLSNAVSQGDQPASRLPLLTAAEREQILVTWNDTHRDYPSETVADLVEAQGERTPNAIAVRSEDASLTYRELDARANQLAHLLRAAGVGPEQRVGVCLERSLELVVALLGILKAGGAFVPLEPGYPPDRLRWLAMDAAAPVLLTTESLARRLPTTGATVIAFDRDAARLAAAPRHHLDRSMLTPDNLAYVIYTSGSTGTPKGAENTHRGLTNRLRWMQEAYALVADDVILQKTPIGFDVSVWEFFWPLLAGACLLVARPDGHRDPTYLTEVINTHKVTTLHFVPSMLQLWLESPGVESCRTIRRVICSGEALSIDLQQKFHARSNAALHNLYGPTEAAIDVTAWACDPRITRATVPIGRPVSNTQIYVLDRYLSPVPIGVAGELHIGGLQVARGYLNRPDLTAKCFVPDPFRPVSEARLYKTGDLARFDGDGVIEFLGRQDGQVKIRGQRIELGEIESAIRQDPQVKDVVVIVREDAPGDKRLVAYLVTTPASTAEAGRADTNEWHADELAHWEDVYSSAIGHGSATAHGTAQDPTRRILGWTDGNYTVEETEEWVAQNVERILALRPADVLEIGCGTGAIVSAIAPYCTTYWATDLSKTAGDYVAQRARAAGSPIAHVQVSQHRADELDGIPSRAFDLVILSSVIQYFPNVDYLVDVLKGATERVRDGGAIYIADVQHHGLLDAFLAAGQLARASDDLPLASLRERLSKRRALRNRLTIDPAFFGAIVDTVPRLSAADWQLRRARTHNQPAKFHYDVVLSVGRSSAVTPAHPAHDWHERRLTIPALQSLLTNGADRLAVTAIPNARLARELQLLDWLASGTGPETVSEARHQLGNCNSGIDPEEIWTMGEHAGYSTSLRWSAAGPLGSIDAVFVSNSAQTDSEVVLRVASSPIARRPWSEYANDPREVGGGFSAQALRTSLSQRLPEHMVPTAFVQLAALPLTPSGKLDRRSLPAPDRASSVSRCFEAPQTTEEKALAAIWAEILNLEEVGIDDDIFELGGDSLLIFRITVKANGSGFRLTPRHLFANRTIRALAAAIVNERTNDHGAPAEVGTGGTAPSPEDFPLASLDRQKLDRVLTALGRTHS